MTRLAAYLSTLVVVLMPFFIILSSLYVFMTPAFVQFEYGQPGFPPAERFAPDARLYNSVQTVRYVWAQISLTDLQNLGVYNAREIRHLVDVQNVARGALIFHAVSGLLIIVALIVLARSPLTRPWAARALVGGGVPTLLVIIAIGLFSLLAFDTFFVTFHHLFFTGDTWLFNLSDSLIQFYPETFWEAASYGIALFVAVCSVLVALTGYVWQRSLSRVPAVPPRTA